MSINVSVGVKGSKKFPRYYIVNEENLYWDNGSKSWGDDLDEATTFAHIYDLKNVVSSIEEFSHREKKAKYYESKCIIKIRCDDDFELEDLQYHLAKCVNIRVSRNQPDVSDSIQDAWVSVALPWETLEEIEGEDYEQH
jgi:hypothetical protein